MKQIMIPDWAHIGRTVVVKDTHKYRGDDRNELWGERVIAYGNDGVFHQEHDCPVYYTEFSKYGKTIFSPEDVRFEIRIFKERFNVDRDYYESDDDVRKRVYCSLSELVNKWKELLVDNEGETYAVWDHKYYDGRSNLVIGGAYDPGDIEYIEDWIKEAKKDVA